MGLNGFFAAAAIRAKPDPRHTIRRKQVSDYWLRVLAKWSMARCRLVFSSTIGSG